MRGERSGRGGSVRCLGEGTDLGDDLHRSRRVVQQQAGHRTRASRPAVFGSRPAGSPSRQVHPRVLVVDEDLDGQVSRHAHPRCHRACPPPQLPHSWSRTPGPSNGKCPTDQHRAQHPRGRVSGLYSKGGAKDFPFEVAATRMRSPARRAGRRRAQTPRAEPQCSNGSRTHSAPEPPDPNREVALLNRRGIGTRDPAHDQAKSARRGTPRRSRACDGTDESRKPTMLPAPPGPTLLREVERRTPSGGSQARARASRRRERHRQAERV